MLVCRPSTRNRSPYVGDVMLTSGPHAGRTAVTHLPNLDSGGKCRPGVRLLCRRQPGVTPETTGKFGTPKCELICQLLRCEEPENKNVKHGGGGGGGGVWVSAHPSIGEKLVQALITRGAFDDRLVSPVNVPPPDDGDDEEEDEDVDNAAVALGNTIDAISSPSPSQRSTQLASSSPAMKSPMAVQSQVTVRRKVGTSTSGEYRPDFRVLHADGSSTVLETKQVVDTDYDPTTAAITAKLQAPHPVYAPGGAVDVNGEKEEEEEEEEGKWAAGATTAMAVHYARAGIFPWGKRGQKGPDGEAVVSARAIEHLRELTSIAKTSSTSTSASTSSSKIPKKAMKEYAAVVLMAGRDDVTSIRPNGAACPSFAKYLEEAREAGVRILGHKCRWGEEEEDLGKAFDAGPVPIAQALVPGDELTFPKPGAVDKKRKKATTTKTKKKTGN